jgi:pimeloyl-ACP methyl ester carboxylesterase
MSNDAMVAAAGGTFHVVDTGETDLVPVVCLHSLFLDNRQFEGFTDAARGRYRVVRPDFRGQGQSVAADREIITMERNAGEMAAVVDALGITNAHFVVSSMGGDVGARVAAYRPDLVRTMVFTGSSARNEPPGQLEEFLQWVDNVANRGFVDDVLEDTMKIMLGESTRSDPQRKDIVDLWTQRIAALTPELKPAMAGVIRRRSALNLLEDITVPTLVISGEEDIARPPEWAREVVERLPDTDLWMMKNTGHSPLLEQPEVVNQRILEFFDQN